MSEGVQVQIGKYTVLSRIGVGGMAEVFLCRQTGLGGFERLVVLKRVLASRVNDTDFVHMLLDEARIAAHLSHSNIVQILEVDEFGGLPYIAMEYVRGPTLRALIQRAVEKDRIHFGHAAKIISGVCAGLHHAHNATDASGRPLGVVHRDVSPDNILISLEGVPKLADFGVAKARGSLVTTGPGQMRGKIRFTAPEIFRGGSASARSDIFSLGACLYEATTGQPAFSAESDDLLIDVVRKGKIAGWNRTSYPPELERLIRASLERDPEKRYQSARELREALETFTRSGPHGSSTDGVAAYVAELFPEGVRLPGEGKPPPLPEVSREIEVSNSAVEVIEGSLGAFQLPAPPPARRTVLASALSIAALAAALLGVRYLGPVAAPGRPDANALPVQVAPAAPDAAARAGGDAAAPVGPDAAEAAGRDAAEAGWDAAAPAGSDAAEPGPDAARPVGHTPRPGVAKPKPEVVKTEPAKSEPSGKSGKLPRQAKAQTSAALARTLHDVEREAIGSGAPAEVIQGITDALYVDLVKELGPGKPVDVFPTAILQVILQEVHAGRDHAAISRKLVYAYRGGALR